MAQKCVHKGCGKLFTDENEPCVYHPGPPEFHEGQKGWKCCKTRVLTFDEFLEIPPCTTGRHSTVDDTPAEAPKPKLDESNIPGLVSSIAEPRANGTSQSQSLPASQTAPQPIAAARASPAPPPEESSDEDSDSTPLPSSKTTCKRHSCNETYDPSTGKASSYECIYHPGYPVFHEGSKGWTCCKKRVLDFDDFMSMPGCKTRDRHMFTGKKALAKAKLQQGEKLRNNVRHDFYQTGSLVHASFYLKKIDKEKSTVAFKAESVDLDLRTSDGKHFEEDVPLFGPIEPDECTFKILGTKLEVVFKKKDGMGWPVLRADEKTSGEIIQTGKAKNAT